MPGFFGFWRSPFGVRHGERCPSPPQPTRRSWAPQRGPGQSPGRRHILAHFEGHRTLLFIYRSWVCQTVFHAIFGGKAEVWGEIDLFPTPTPPLFKQFPAFTTWSTLGYIQSTWTVAQPHWYLLRQTDSTLYKNSFINRCLFSYIECFICFKLRLSIDSFIVFNIFCNVY